KIKNYTEYLTVMDEDWTELDEPQVVQHYPSTTISFSPSVILSNEFAYAPIPSLEFSLASKYVSRQFLYNTQSTERSVDPFYVYNLRFRFAYSLLGLEDVDANLAVEIIFNEEYESHAYTYGGITPTVTRLYGD